MVAFEIQQHDLDQFPEWDVPVGSWAIYLPVSRVYYFVPTKEDADAFLKEHESYRRHLVSTAAFA
jgi:hypothetical protein